MIGAEQAAAIIREFFDPYYYQQGDCLNGRLFNGADVGGAELEEAEKPTQAETSGESNANPAGQTQAT